MMPRPPLSALPPTARGQADNLKSLSKVIKMLGCFSATDRALHPVEICRRTAYPRSTTHRLLAAMRQHGLLDQDRGGERYRLGLKLFEFGNTVLANMDLPREARPFVDTLARLTEQRIHLAVFDGRRAAVVHRDDPVSESKAALNVIEFAPAHCTSVRKAILGYQPASVVERPIASGSPRFTDRTITDPETLRQHLAAVRERGYAVDDGEHQPGLRCVGAPVRDRAGRVFAAISVSGPARRLPLRKIAALARIVVHNANAIPASLGHRGG